MAATRFASVRKEGDDVRHHVDQFSWYRHAVSQTFDSDEYDGRRYLSAVDFHLPSVSGQEPDCHLTVVGDGLACDAYLLKLAGGAVKRSALWRLFSYRDRKVEFGWAEKPKTRVELHKIFTTDISPFLGGDYPTNGRRIYDFNVTSTLQLDLSNHLSVIANNNKDAEKEYFELIYVPDMREGKPRTITRLREYRAEGWSSEELAASISTESFTFGLWK